jgi:hypothetical protein
MRYLLLILLGLAVASAPTFSFTGNFGFPAAHADARQGGQ